LRGLIAPPLLGLLLLLLPPPPLHPQFPLAFPMLGALPKPKLPSAAASCPTAKSPKLSNAPVCARGEASIEADRRRLWLSLGGPGCRAGDASPPSLSGVPSSHAFPPATSSVSTLPARAR
jgi:hypothetical protein